jgi:hypothetical protein
MPELPFTYEDLTNWNPVDEQRAAQESKPDMSQMNPINKAQSFLKGKMSQLKGHMQSAEGLIDVGYAMNPVTRIVDMGSKFFGGPGLTEGYKHGTTMTGQVRVPPTPF